MRVQVTPFSSWETHRAIAQLPTPDPEAGQTVMEPEQAGAGYWVGCPALLYEADRGRFLMTYRNRRPRGAGDDRGWRCAIAESSDGVNFVDIWSVQKSDLASPSMERFSLLRGSDGRYLLYLSYVDPEDNRWRIDLLEADAPELFNVEDRTGVLTALDTGTEGVKDPYTLAVGPAVYMYVSVAAARDFSEEEQQLAHSSGDIHATGVTTLPSGLAVSGDGGRTFQWKGQVLEVGSSWDAYESRLTSILPMQGLFLGFYDGSASVDENYEERCGLTLSLDLASWTRLTPEGPWLTSPHSSGSLRYVDAIAIGDEIWMYYEYARPDGSHELRLSRLVNPMRVAHTS